MDGHGAAIVVARLTSRQARQSTVTELTGPGPLRIFAHEP